MKKSSPVLVILMMLSWFFTTYPTQGQNYHVENFLALQAEDGIEIYRLENGVILEKLTLLENIYLDRAEFIENSNDWVVKNFQDFSSSFDGKHIAFTAYQGEQNALFIYNIWESTLQQTLIPFSKRPIWSPDSQRIWLKSIEYPFQDIVYDLSENAMFEHSVNRAFWMPTGSELVYVSNTSSSEQPTITQNSLFLVDYNSQNYQRLTDLGNEFPEIEPLFMCNPAFSTFSRRFYYVVGCSPYVDDYSSYIYSVGFNIDDRLELDIQAYFGENYYKVAGIYPSMNEGVIYIVIDSSGYMPNENGRNVLMSNYRILEISNSNNVNVIYENVTQRQYIQSSSISPDYRFIAINSESNPDSGVYLGKLQIFDLLEGEVTQEIDFSPNTVCNPIWLSETLLTYNVVPDYGCSLPYENLEWTQELLNVETGEVTSLSPDTPSQFSWIIRPTVIDSPIPLEIITDGATMVTESGDTDTYTLALVTEPTADVTVSMASDAAQLTVSPSTLTFTSENWDTPQTVTIAAVDDTLVEGEHTSVITHSAASIDPAYDGIAVASVTVTIVDNDIEPTAIPTATDTPIPPTPTDTTSPMPTGSSTPMPSHTPSFTPTETPSLTPTATFTETPTHTPTITLTPSHTPTITLTPSRTPTITLTPSRTPTVTLTPSHTPTATPDPNPCDESDVVPGLGWILFSAGNGTNGRSIYAARPNDSQPIRLTCGSTSFIDLQPVWSADRSLIVFTRQTSPEVPSSLWIMRADNPAGAVPLTTGVNTPTVGLRPTFSPDGQWIAYTSDSDLYAIRINPATLQVVPGTLVNLTPAGNHVEIRPDWSPVTDPNHPNYNRITYVSYRAAGSNLDGNSEIYTMKVTFTNGIPSLSERVQVTNTTTINGVTIDNQYPRWSQDGNYIAYSSNMRDGTDFDIHRIKYNATTATWGNRVNLTGTQSLYNDEFAAWDPELIYGSGETPDNTYRFVFASQRSDGFRIVLMERRGGGTPTLTLSTWSDLGIGTQRFPDW